MSDAKGHRERLRRRFQAVGLNGFHDHEVLELLLTYAIPRRDVKKIAKDLLEKFGSLSAVIDAHPQILEKVNGLGPKAALFISLVAQLFRRYEQDKFSQKKKIRCIEDALKHLKPFVDKPFESLWAVVMNSANDVLATEMIQAGSVNKVSVIPRLVVEAVITHRATAIILAHNHPSGNPEPSTMDKEITKILQNLLHQIDVTLLDHIIIAGTRYFSFAEKGLL